MIKLGISTSILDNKNEIEKLLPFAPEVIEFYNYPAKELKKILDFCDKHNIKPALHTPLPWEKELKRFMPTGPGRELFQEALDMTEITIKCAAEIDALHVVVHFPSPIGLGIPEGRDAIDRFLNPIAEHSVRLGVRVLIENVSPNPDFFSPEHYLSILERYNPLEFCLDIGHAHLLDPTCKVEDFINTIGKKIRSAHIYNTHVLRYKAYGHEPIEEQQSEETGWINIPRTFELLKRKANLEVIILEYGDLWINKKDPESIRFHTEKIKRLLEND